MPYLRNTWAVLVLALGIAGSGCANGAPKEGDTGGGWGSSFTSDGGARPDCESGEHECGATCVEDMPNDPENGCRLGCGEPCDVPAGATATCTSAGRCDFTCPTGATRMGNTCSCTPRTCAGAGAQCGAVDDGCGGTLDCGMCGEGQSCEMNICSCPTDDAEPNDVQAIAKDLGELTDAPRTTRAFDAYTLHSTADVDWYRFVVSDGFDVGNPTVDITLSNMPAGADYDLGVWYVCNSGGDGSSCQRGRAEELVGRGCVSDADGSGNERVVLEASCSGTNESGQVLVRVRTQRPADACGAYRLDVDVN